MYLDNTYHTIFGCGMQATKYSMKGGWEHNLYEKIKKLLKERNSNLAELSRESHVPLQTLYNLKARSGKNGSLSVKNAVKIAEFLGVTVDELLSEQDDDSK